MEGYLSQYIDLNTPPSTPDFREYIQNQLVSTLISGHTYIVTFYVSLGDNLKYSTSRLGCYFSNQQIIDSALSIICWLEK